jgi:thiamine pyrophosphate-dependent acetolactate synthase large subunit-like protein
MNDHNRKKDARKGTREFYPNAASVFAEALKEHGVEMAFGVHGGDLWNIVDEISRIGIRLITVHHEQTAVYAAEAYAKATGKVGVFYADTGPGSANAASALQQCHLSCSPVLGIVGGPIIGHEKSYTIQPSYAEHMFSHITKWTQRIVADFEVKHFVSKAFKDAQAYPKGPCVIEFPLAAMVGFPTPPSYQAMAGSTLYKHRWRGDETGKPLPQPGGDPVLIENLVRKIYQAEKPVIFAGDGLHWSNASKELITFAEKARVPVCGRRVGRGIMPETHPLHFSSRIHRQVLPQSDLLIAIGMKIGFFDSNFGSDWPKCVQINESPEHIFESVDTDMILLGGPKIVLNQMVEKADALGLAVSRERESWIEEIRKRQEAADAKLAIRALKYQDHEPVHHGWLCKALWDTCEDLYGGKNRLIIDGYTISGFIPPFPKARYSGQIMDSSEQAGVGHGIGMAIGAALGDPESKYHPVISLMGDAGMGNSGFDIETAVRYELPIVYVVTNNDGWLTGMKYHYYGKNWDVLGPQDRHYGQAFLPDIRYEKLSEVFGVHGEYVRSPKEFKPAFTRALRSAEKGKPAVLNVIVDPTLINPVTYNLGYAAGWGHIPWKELPKRGKAIRRNYLFLLPWHEADEKEWPQPDPWEPLTEDEMMP